jgi:hypothetical protein
LCLFTLLLSRCQYERNRDETKSAQFFYKYFFCTKFSFANKLSSWNELPNVTGE